MEGLPMECEEGAAKSAEVERMVALVTKAMEGENRSFAESLVFKQDKDLLGRGEFELRDTMLRAGSRALEATLNDRKKRGTKAAAQPVLIAKKRHASSNGGASES